MSESETPVADDPETILGEVTAEEDDGPADPEDAERSALARVERAQELVPLKPPETVVPTVNEFAAMKAIANEISTARGFVPNDLLNKPNAILAAILKGRELGIGPMQSMSDISIIDGRPALSAQLMLALIRKQGHRVDGQVNDDRAIMRGKRADTGEELTVEWTYAEAERVRDRKGQALTDKANWRNYRTDMLWARAVGRLARRLFPDVIAGMGYSAEEMQDFDGDWDNPYDHLNADEEGTLRHRADAPLPNLPGSWAEVMDRVRRYGGDDLYGWPEWFDQAAIAEYDKPLKELPESTRKLEFFQIAQRFVAQLDLDHSPDVMPPLGRMDVAKVWAKVLPSGSLLGGPNIPIDPEEHRAAEARAAQQEDPNIELEVKDVSGTSSS